MNEGNSIVFNLLTMMNPGSTQETEPFEISVFEQTDIIFKIENSGLTYRATPGTLDNIVVAPDNTKTRIKIPYSFQFETRNSVFQGGAIGITVPEEIEVDMSTIEIRSFSTIRGAITRSMIEFDEATRILKINDAFETAHDGPQRVVFRITEGFRNGMSTKPVKPFLITTLDPEGKIID